MTDVMLTDDHILEQTATDIRVFGKWSGAEIQISDMSLEVGSSLLDEIAVQRVLLSRITFSALNNRNFFLIPLVVIK